MREEGVKKKIKKKLPSHILGKPINKKHGSLTLNPSGIHRYLIPRLDWQGIAEKHRGGVTTEAGTRHGYSRRVQASSLEWRARTLKCMVALRQHRYFQAPDVSLREHLGKETPENWEEIYYRPDPRFNDPIFEGPPCSRPAWYGRQMLAYPLAMRRRYPINP